MTEQILTFATTTVALCPTHTSKPRREAEHEAVTRCLQRLLGDTPLDHTTTGAPILPEYPGTYISVSHCAGMAAVAIDHTRPVGIDIETPRKALATVVPRIATSDEIACFGTPDNLSTLLDIWTAKEAAFKCASTLASPPQVLSDITLTSRHNASLAGSPRPISLTHTDLSPAIRLALATASPS